MNSDATYGAEAVRKVAFVLSRRIAAGALIFFQARQSQARPLGVGGASINQGVERGGQRRIIGARRRRTVFGQPGEQIMASLEGAAHLKERETTRQLVLARR